MTAGVTQAVPFADEQLRVDQQIRADEPIRIPALPEPPPPPPFPFMSAVVPMIGAGVLWMVTGSTTTLWFAALGPVLAVASVLDGRRGRRRSQRRQADDLLAKLAVLREEVGLRHASERRLRWARHPDVAWHLERPDETWRSVDGRRDGITVGRGDDVSALRIEGGDDSGPGRELVRSARILERAPVVLPLTVGVAVCGPLPFARAVARGLTVQACLNLPPGRLRVDGAVQGWGEELPHAAARTGIVMRVYEPGQRVADDAEAPVVVVAEGEPPPPRCGAVVSLLSPGHARLDHGADRRVIEVLPVSIEQARAVATALAERAAATQGGPVREVPRLLELLDFPECAVEASPTHLRAAVGIAGEGAAVVDIAGDGPHAVVIGVTGSGKSELLITWVAALAARRTPQEVSFLLVDFKGGRSFEALEVLPHVTGVLTDLDETAALRAIDSLRAEVRHRERVLASVGARDVAESGGALGRLIVVVDEYAALVSAHPALHDLFADIAARGRALGMHLILASQRAAGVFRDSVLSNAPLRLALRVTDPADSRAVLGCDDAAALSGRSEDRGHCLVRGPADAAPRPIRVSRCLPGDIVRLVPADVQPARRPWLPPLSAEIALDDHRVPGRVVLGIADEPEHQRQRPVELRDDEPGLAVVGSAGTGKTSALRSIAAQAPGVVVVPSDPETGWDAIAAADQLAPGGVVLVDDVDVLLGRLGGDHATIARDRLERLAREARSRGVRVVVSAQRSTGPVARIIESLPRRLLLAHATRTDYLASGGESADFTRLPPGRGHLDGVLTQVLWTPGTGVEAPEADSVAPRESPWHPERHPVAFVAFDGPRTQAVLESWRSRGAVIARVDEPGLAWRPGNVVWGAPDVWLAQWRALADARACALTLIDVACAAQYRAVTGDPQPPPYAKPHAARAWLRTPDGIVTRIVLPT